MSEYEVANLSLQQANLDIQHANLGLRKAALGLQQAALTATYWQTGISAGLSLLTLAVSSSLVLYGFRLMRRGTERRAREADQRHTEAMTALRTLISGTERRAREADQRHTEAMTALRTLIKRTAPPGASDA